MDAKWIWYIIGIAIIFAFVYLGEQNAKKRVVDFLEHRGCRVISIKTRLFTGGRGTITFDVEYEDSKGISKKTHVSFIRDFFRMKQSIGNAPLARQTFIIPMIRKMTFIFGVNPERNTKVVFLCTETHHPPKH